MSNSFKFIRNRSCPKTEAEDDSSAACGSSGSLLSTFRKFRLAGRVKKVKSEAILTCRSTPTEENQEQRMFSIIPESIWIASILPLLDRWSQNKLVQSSRCVWLARRQLYSNQHACRNVKWPAPGRIPHFQRPRPIVSLSFSPNGDHLVAAMARSKKILVYDKLWGPLPSLAGHKGPVIAVKYSSKGNMLATASRNDGTIRLCSRVAAVNAKQTTPYECFRIIQSYQNRLRHIIWSPDSQWIASWGDDGFLRVASIENGFMYSTFWKTRMEVASCLETVAFDPRNPAIVAFSFNNDVVRLWNFESDEIRVLPESQDMTRSYDGTYVTAVAYSPDCHYLAVGCHVSSIRLWTVSSPDLGENGGEIGSNEGSNHHSNENFSLYNFSKKIHVGPGWSAVSLIQFTSDSKYIACTGNGAQIRVVHVSTGHIVGNLNGHTARVEALCFSLDNFTLASSGRDRSIRFWTMQDYYRNQEEYDPQQTALVTHMV